MRRIIIIISALALGACEPPPDPQPRACALAGWCAYDCGQETAARGWGPEEYGACHESCRLDMETAGIDPAWVDYAFPINGSDLEAPAVVCHNAGVGAWTGTDRDPLETCDRAILLCEASLQ